MVPLLCGRKQFTKSLIEAPNQHPSMRSSLVVPVMAIMQLTFGFARLTAVGTS
jgi:hypothetical protein